MTGHGESRRKVREMHTCAGVFSFDRPIWRRCRRISSKLLNALLVRGRTFAFLFALGMF